jgi:binding-protein-dependent transport system inner membrane component
MIRAFVREELGKDYVVAARAKGAGTGRVLRAHVGANVLPPLVAMIGMTVGVALAGIVFVETAFGLPGLCGMVRQSKRAIRAKEKGAAGERPPPRRGTLRASRAQPVVLWSSVAELFASVAALFAWSAAARSQLMAQRSQSCWFVQLLRLLAQSPP